MAATGVLRNAALKSMFLPRSARTLAKVDALVSNDIDVDGVGLASCSVLCAELRGGESGGGDE